MRPYHIYTIFDRLSYFSNYLFNTQTSDKIDINFYSNDNYLIISHDNNSNVNQSLFLLYLFRRNAYLILSFYCHDTSTPCNRDSLRLQ